MTLDEAKRLGDLASSVDDGCVDCVTNFVGRLNRAFPDFIWSVREGQTEGGWGGPFRVVEGVDVRLRGSDETVGR